MPLLESLFETFQSGLVNLLFLWIALCFLFGFFFSGISSRWFASVSLVTFLLASLSNGVIYSLGIDSDNNVFVFSYLLVLNIAILPYLYWFDKRNAKRDTSNLRVPENVLHVLSFLGGAIGAYVSQRVFRHKTKKREFQIVYWVSFAFSFLIYILLLINLTEINPDRFVSQFL